MDQPFENVYIEIFNDHAWRGYEFLKSIFQLVQGKNLYLFLKRKQAFQGRIKSVIRNASGTKTAVNLFPKKPKIDLTHASRKLRSTYSTIKFSSSKFLESLI